MASWNLDKYRKHVAERAAEGVVPKPLAPEHVQVLVELLKNPPKGEEALLEELITNRVPPGVDPAAEIKAKFLTQVVKGEVKCPLIDKPKAIKLLGLMVGGYNIAPLVDLLGDKELGPLAATELKHTILVFDQFSAVAEKAKTLQTAKDVLQSWANGEWFTTQPKLGQKVTVIAYKVPGEINTDDLSPAPDAWSRPDIPLHAKAMLKNPREGVTNAGEQIAELKKSGFPVAFISDVMGTGSSRKSATNSVLWYIGSPIPGVPNKNTGGVCFGGKVAPIFFNTMEDSGALVFECDVTKIKTGDVLDIDPYAGKITDHKSGAAVCSFSHKSEVILDEVQAQGRINLIIGRGLTAKARQELGLPTSTLFRLPQSPPTSNKGYTLAQKIIGRACGVAGVRANQYCEPKMTTVGSQDTTGPMTRDELKDLACLGFSADLVMQSFCHTAAYPKPVDVEMQRTLPDFIRARGGVALRPGDGIIHSWLNRMLLPDTAGTGGDSHTRFPIGISFPAGSGLVAFAAATGSMPLDMPESILVRFKGTMQPGITLRDLVNAIPYAAIKRGLLTVAKAGKKNCFNGRILEIEGLPNLKVEQAFELSDASAERSAAGCTIRLAKEPVIEYLKSNVVLLRWMISQGYGDPKTLERRARKMEEWLANPVLMEPDADAEYAEVIEIDMTELKEPILACPNDPDDVKLLSDVKGTKIDEVFIGSCMTNIGHFRAVAKVLAQQKGPLPTRLWVAPPTKMDAEQLKAEGYFGMFGDASARMEMPGCSLCMGNQARVAPKATVVSTSTRNFPNRLGDGSNVYLSSAELAAVAAITGKLPTPEEYLKFSTSLTEKAADIYKYLNFNEMGSYTDAAAQVKKQNA
eukprot:RCo003529